MPFSIKRSGYAFSNFRIRQSAARSPSSTTRSGGRAAAIYLEDGQPIDATCGAHEGERAVYAVAGWREGRFQFTPRMADRPQRIFASAEGLLVEAMRRLDEEREALASLPGGPHAQLAIASGIGEGDCPEGTAPGDLERLRAIVDGRRLLPGVLAELRGDLELVRLLADLYARGLVKDVAQDEL